MATIRKLSLTHVLALMMVVPVLGCSTASVAADPLLTPAQTQSAQAKAADPASMVSGSAEPPSAEPTSTRPTSSAKRTTASTAAPSALTDAPKASADPAAAIPAPAIEAMPVGDLPGWKQVFAEDFTDGDVPIGGFPGATYSERWSENYVDGTPDTAGKRQPKGERTSGYYPSKVLSVHDGLLDMYLHTENGVSMGAAPSPKFAGITQWPYNSQVYGRYSVRFKADSLPGFKAAWLLWPVSKQWPQDGEIDFPEGDLSKVIYAALHGVGPEGHTTQVFRPNVPYTSWHTATTEWSPGRIEFFLDGQSIGVTTSLVPDKPMRYLLQTESCLTGCPLPETRGHVYVDWVAIWARS